MLLPITVQSWAVPRTRPSGSMRYHPMQLQDPVKPTNCHRKAARFILPTPRNTLRIRASTLAEKTHSVARRKQLIKERTVQQYGTEMENLIPRPMHRRSSCKIVQDLPRTTGSLAPPFAVTARTVPEQETAIEMFAPIAITPDRIMKSTGDFPALNRVRVETETLARVRENPQQINSMAQ
ncbi:uncharacterized protein ZHAS_00016580 [Anopheles sinensis]|uniref:Uncharacterized protein n=1 Tax=Anopheles sinensis TaxID=74873 RepID=A0A084WEE9_ANOSI|nr:uncharacterized protein ZHAS_00016580 [Anopheles sinensis]